MAESFPNIDITLPVGASALTQYELVKTVGGVVVSAAATDDCLGVVQNGADANADGVTVRIFGVSRIVAHGAITKGAGLVPAAAGRIDEHDGTTANPIVGIALEAATAQDDEILAFIGGPHMLAGPAA